LKATLTGDLLEKLRALSKADRLSIGAAINQVMENWGKPHMHSGIGVRRLTRNIHECRIGLDKRLAFIFITTPPELVFFFLGNHDEIQKLIRS
jgi:hypothetical protein